MTPLTFVVVALALGLPLSTRAVQQTTAVPDDGKREFVVSGCLLRNGYAGYAVEDSRVIAIDGERLPEPTPASAAMPKKWILEGGGNLGPQTGQKVEVTGRTDWQSRPAQPSTEEPPDRIPHLDVKSLKTVAPSCA